MHVSHSCSISSCDDRIARESRDDELCLQLVTGGLQPGNDRLNLLVGIGPWKNLGFEATREKKVDFVPYLSVAHGFLS
ncbi:hypothetical protein ACVWW1_008402 [Bradyrhizobium sp. JR3.5]